MAQEREAQGFFFFFTFLLLSLHVWSCSGTLIGFAYDARQENPKLWSPREVLPFLHMNKVSSSQYWVFLSKPEAFLDSLANTQIPIDIFLSTIQSKVLCESRSSAISWIETHIIKNLPYLNVSNIIVETGRLDLNFLLLTLNSIHSALEKFEVNGRIKVSPMLSFSNLEKNITSIAKFVKQTESFISIEAFVDSEYSIGGGFVHSVLTRALSACTLLLPYPETPLALNIRSSIAPSEVEMGELNEKLMRSIDGHPHLKERISGLFIEISSLAGSVHRQLFDQKTVTIHDTFAPFTIPSTNPSLDIITVPSTNPITAFPTPTPITVPSTNPITTPITFPSINPTNPPITVPAADPVTNPTTTPITIPPLVPITNPVTTPTTNPVTTPATNFPFPPPALVTPIPGMPGTMPVSPTIGSGQSWCIAKGGVPEEALQNALDYACGIGGADCSSIQMSGSCYNPNTLQDHASYAFNSYYQKNPVPTSCDFGGTAMVVTTNPSSGTCIYSSSSSGSNFNPAPGSNTGFGSTGNPVPGSNTGIGSTGNPVPSSNTGTGSTGIGGSTGTGIGPTGVTPTYGSNSGSGSSVLNTNNSDGSNTVFGSDSPTGTLSSGPCFQPEEWRTLLSIIFTASFLTSSM